MNARCKKARSLLALRAADLSVAEQEYLNAHVPNCPDCAAWARQCREQDVLISGLPAVRPSSSKSQQFLAQTQTIRRQHVTFTHLKSIVSVAGWAAVLVALILVVRSILLPSALFQGVFPASEDTPVVLPVTPDTPPTVTPDTPDTPTPVTPTSESRPVTPIPPTETPIPTPDSSQWVTPAPTPDDYPGTLSSWESPDGQWLAQLRSSQRDKAPEDALCSGSESERPTAHSLHIVFNVLGRDGSARWTMWDEWICGLGYTMPQFITWSQDSQHLYFTVKSVPDGDPPVFKHRTAGISRLDLADGQVTTMAVPDGYAHTISPDESRIVYTSPNNPPELVVHDIATGTEQRVAFWNELFSASRDQTEAGSVLWTPDAGSLYLMAVNGYLGNAEYAVARLDLSSLTVTPLIENNQRLIWPRNWVDGRLLVADWNGVTWWVDTQTGETTTSPLEPVSTMPVSSDSTPTPYPTRTPTPAPVDPTPTPYPTRTPTPAPVDPTPTPYPTRTPTPVS
ncbi:MAG: hypothetical protein JXA21_23980, partial [Anaerolineae bacterium]|nr:hypothetical protein [Anaerolineae bacterium]